jgi:hypothetical protein
LSQGKTPYRIGFLLQTCHPPTFSKKKNTISEEEIHLQTSETTSNSSAGQAGETAIKQIYAYL